MDVYSGDVAELPGQPMIIVNWHSTVKRLMVRINEVLN